MRTTLLCLILVFCSALVVAGKISSLADDIANEVFSDASYTARGTGYYPDPSPMEGGYKDRLGKPLRTLQAFVSGKATYVSVAMDPKVFSYGTILDIPSISKKYGKKIRFCVCDT